MTLSWEGEKRVHGYIIHIEIIENKIWIQRDGTEYGIANELVNAGIPKSQIVLAFHPLMVECFRLNDKGLWELQTYNQGDEINLISVDFKFPIELLYEDVIFENLEE